MSALQTILDKGVANNAAHFLVAMTGNAAGVTWSGAAGEAAPGMLADEKTVFRIFSMTKAVGSTAAMILIDQGKLDPDMPVEEIIPDFANIKRLDRFEGDKPVLVEPANKATVRHLSTHTSGLTYEFWNHDIPRYMEAAGHPTILSGLKASLFYPLTFEPGARWDYGIGIDWLSQVVETIDGRTIDVFVKEEILDPLGMSDTSFEVSSEQENRLATVKIRNESGALEDFALAPPPQPEFYGMGHALYSTPTDYMRFLRSFLNKGELDGNRILSEGAVDNMLANNIGDIRIDRMVTSAPALTADTELFPGYAKSHSFGFLRMEDDVPGMRAAGSQGWAGVCNTHYWFDLTNDVAAVLMTQTLPFVEAPYMNVYTDFEKAVYAGL